jgi:hypothetical protein
MKKKKDIELKAYADIIHLPHHVSRTRPQMHIVDRAAQFAPFAAVVGHEHAVKEAARTTDQRKELDEMEKSMIDDQLREIEVQLPNRFDVKVSYFEPDEFKDGGNYIVKVGKVKKFDRYLREVQMVDGTRIAIDEIRSIVQKRPQSDK